MKTKIILIASYILLSFVGLSYAGAGKTPKCCKNKEACCEAKAACCDANKNAKDCCVTNEECCNTNEACCTTEARDNNGKKHCKTNGSEKTKKACCN